MENRKPPRKENGAEPTPIEKAKRKYPWVKWGALAACFALALLIIIKIISTVTVGFAKTEKLSMLVITEDSGETTGLPGARAYDISEIINANPWTERTKVSSLPVYQNIQAYESIGTINADLDKMKGLLLELANRLGMSAHTIKITDDTPNAETQAAIINKFDETGDSAPEGYFTPSSVNVEDNGIRVEVDQQMIATVRFKPALSLPEGYNFTYYAAYDEVVAVAQYLKEEYMDFIGMDNPKINVYGGAYDLYSQQAYSIEFYDGSGDITDQIVNYNFNRVAFYCDDEGKLYMARVFQPDLSIKVGDYPIITVSEAKEQLKNGGFVSPLREKGPDLQSVAKVELIYRTGSTEKYFMPYYRFFVELSDKRRDNGLRVYQIYDVPAVEGKYISNMPVWD